ncbi:MAG: hypothetical protein E5Y61_06970 [Mesorhizobium sp.]|nr:MAG: hypothetical protein E5Y61_06970 [Mesorhizobium sp.]
MAARIARVASCQPTCPFPSNRSCGAKFFETLDGQRLLPDKALPSPLVGEGGRAKLGRMRGAPAWHQQHSVQHPSTVLALRANPPSPTRGEGKTALLPPPAIGHVHHRCHNVRSARHSCCACAIETNSPAAASANGRGFLGSEIQLPGAHCRLLISDASRRSADDPTSSL